jgi:hypothetical protein
VICSTAILLETEGRYQSFPDYRGAPPARRFEVVLTFRRAPAEDAGAGEDGAAAAAVQARDMTVMTVQVGPRDTVDTLNRRIRVRTCCCDC